MAGELNVVGKRIPVADGFAKVTGQAKYAGDVHVPGLIRAKVLRSPHPHARVRKIDTSKAEKMPGVLAVLSPNNWPGGKVPLTSGEPVFQWHPLMVGDAIAAVAAVDQYTAHEALKLIEVDYEVLPSVFDLEDALKPDAPKLTDKGNLVERSGGNPFFLTRAGVRDDEAEDLDKGMAKADRVFEGTYTTHMQLNASPEHRATIAMWEGSKLTVWSTSQGMFPSRADMARSLGIRLNDVQYISPFRGGGYGATNANHGQGDYRTIAAVLARMTNRPVKIEFTRTEEFIVGQGRNASKQTVRVGVTNAGRIVAVDADSMYNTGGHASGQSGLATPGVGFATSFGGMYRAPARNKITIALSNMPAGSEFRGFGGPESVFCLESLVDEIAYKLDTDPLEFRLKNAEFAPTVYGTGPMIAPTLSMIEAMQQGSAKFGWKTKFHKPGAGPLVDKHKKRGVGMALWLKSGGGNRTYGMVKVHADGTVQTFIGAANMGTSNHTTLSQIVAEVLGVRWENIRPHFGNTDVDAWDHITNASRVALVGGNAFRLAAEDAKRKLLALAAINPNTSKVLGTVKPEELDIMDGQFVLKSDTTKKAPITAVFGDIQEVTGLGTWTQDDFDPRAVMDRSTFPPKAWDIMPVTGRRAAAVSSGAAFVEVEVDIETGAVSLPHVVIAADVGRAINPTVVEGQLEGGFLQQMSWALMEGVVMDKATGVATNVTSWLDYKMVTARETPKLFETIIIEKPNPSGAFGVNILGEATTLVPAPAIANAIYNATGVRIRDLPITPDKIVAGLKAL